ncbi:Subtilisin [compost metagenome]
MHIINMSFGMKTRSSALQSIIRKAYSENIVVVASAGNDKKNRVIDYPAKYTQTISVGATGRNGKIALFSNRGPNIDIYAPGERIHSAWLGGGYREMSGTSMATSHVSGTIALMLSIKSGLKPDEIRKRLRRTARPIGGNNKNQASIGEVCASRMVKATKQAQ